MGKFAHWMTPTRRIMVFNDRGFDPGPNAELIENGDWLPRMILDRLVRDTKLYVSFYNMEQAHNFKPGLVEDEVYWADSSGIVHIEVVSPEFKGWGAPFQVLGLEISNGPKLAKRLKELVRLIPYYSSSPVDVKYFRTSEATEKFYDGMSIMSRSYAKRLGLKRSVKRVNLRINLVEAMIKGDGVIISDKQMVRRHGRLYDVVTADVNLKFEVRTTGWSFSTANPYHDHGQARLDEQSASWLREWLYPEKQVKETFTTVVDTRLEGLRNGEWPSWMFLAEEVHSDDIHHLPRSTESVLEKFFRHYLRWQMYGMKPEHSASIQGMAANGFRDKLQSRRYHPFSNKSEMLAGQREAYRNSQPDPWRPKTWLPLPWAVYGHIITHQILRLAGFKIPSGCEDKLFYHEETGSFSLPGDQFADTFDAHGTWDLDDTAKFFLRKMDGRVVVVIVRSPNSDGEYSIHEVGNIEDFPLYHQYGEMPEIDHITAPMRIEAVQQGQVIAGMPANARVMDPDFTREEAQHSIDIQELNPGVGGTANAMMVYYASLRKSPTHVLAAMGDIVDTVEQTPYEEGFVAITGFKDQLWNEIHAYGKVDSYLGRTRVPPMVNTGLEKYDGYFTRIFSHFEREVDRYSEESRAIAFRNRAANPIPEIMAMEFTPAVMTEAGRWIEKAEGRFKAIPKKHRGSSIKAKQARTKAYRDLVRQMVNTLTNMDEDVADNLVLAIYRVCCIPGAGIERHGRSDQLLFQPADAQQISVMEFFLRALIKLGVAQDPRS